MYMYNVGHESFNVLKFKYYTKINITSNIKTKPVGNIKCTAQMTKARGVSLLIRISLLRGPICLWITSVVHLKEVQGSAISPSASLQAASPFVAWQVGGRVSEGCHLDRKHCFACGRPRRRNKTCACACLLNMLRKQPCLCTYMAFWGIWRTKFALWLLVLRAFCCGYVIRKVYVLKIEFWMSIGLYAYCGKHKTTKWIIVFISPWVTALFSVMLKRWHSVGGCQLILSPFWLALVACCENGN